MAVGILSILIGLSFLFAALIELASWWGRPIGMAIGAAGIVVSTLLIVAGTSIVRSWPRARQIVILAAGSTMVFTSIAGSLNFMGRVAVALGMGLPIALVLACFRHSKAGSGRQEQDKRPDAAPQ